MIYTAPKGRYVYGVPIGILMFEEDYCAIVPGAVCNAGTYDFPILLKQIKGFPSSEIFSKSTAMLDKVIRAAKELEAQGVRAITSTCGFFAIFQQEIAEAVDVPVFLSSLLQLPFMSMGIRKQESIGLVTFNSEILDEDFLRCACAEKVNIHVAGLQYAPYFRSHVLEGDPAIDTDRICEEVVDATVRLVQEHPDISMILLECSELPPYAKAVQDAVGLPVFDFYTMIQYIYTSVVRKEFSGIM